jgi:hypothetical protein
MIVRNAGLVFKVGRQTPLATRPVSWTLRHRLSERLLWPLIALFWMTMTVFLACDMLRSGETWGLAMPGVFLLVGIWLFLFGIRASLWRRRETIDVATVTVEERDSAGGWGWSEPLAGYRGIAIIDVERERPTMLGRLKVVVLDHERAERRIVLWSQLLSRDVERWREDYAAWLDMPVVKPLPWRAPQDRKAAAVVRRA